MNCPETLVLLLVKANCAIKYVQYNGMTNECLTDAITNKTNMLQGKVNCYVGGRKLFKAGKKANSKVHSNFKVFLQSICLRAFFRTDFRSFVARSVRKLQANTFPNEPLSDNKYTRAA